MKNTSTLNKKLKSYSALAGSLVAIGSAADAQIMYTDVIPDAATATGNTYALDLDNGGAVDFNLQVANNTYMYGTIAIMYNYALAIPNDPTNAIDTASTGGPKVHGSGESIDNSLMWVDGSVASYQLMGLAFVPPFSAYDTGNFLGTTDKYLGLRFVLGANDHYGWVRVDLNASATLLTIKDYAYDATPLTPIVTGMLPTAIAESMEGSFNIYGYDNAIHIKMTGGATAEGTAVVTDVLGQEVASTRIENENTSIGMESAKSGVYFVTITKADGNSFTKKILMK